jgi:hypothetical protein
MGLDTTHDCWHGAYSSFNHFRHLLANQIGLNLDDYYGYITPQGYTNATKDLKSIEHDIQPLLDHSDCDGKLTIRQCRRIVKGLNSILENFKAKETYEGFKEEIIQFRDGCLDAISKKEQVEFH